MLVKGVWNELILMSLITAINSDSFNSLSWTKIKKKEEMLGLGFTLGFTLTLTLTMLQRNQKVQISSCETLSIVREKQS